MEWSDKSRYYSIKNLEKAPAYLDHSVLGPRLVACSHALLELEERSALDIFGSIDAQKLQSYVTLFGLVKHQYQAVFIQVLEKYYNGNKDFRTIALLRAAGEDV